jgi:hypothetical protein
MRFVYQGVRFKESFQFLEDAQEGMRRWGEGI